MLSILGTIVGFLGSFIPELLKIWKQKQDHKHELEVMKLQAEMAKAAHLYRLEEIGAQADVASEQAVYQAAEQKLTGSTTVDAIIALYNSFVRPTVTYLFMFGYLFIKYAQYKVWAPLAESKWDIIARLWTSDDMACFMVIISFWFGSRAMKHMLQHYTRSK